VVDVQAALVLEPLAADRTLKRLRVMRCRGFTRVTVVFCLDVGTSSSLSCEYTPGTLCFIVEQSQQVKDYNYTHLTASFPRQPGYRKGKTSLDLYEARDDGVWDGSGISCTICQQSAPRSRQIATPTPHHSMFTGQMLFLTPNQQCQSTEGHSTG